MPLLLRRTERVEIDIRSKEVYRAVYSAHSMICGCAAPLASRRLSGAILLAALGVLAASLPAQGDADCVTVRPPKLGVKYAFRFTDAAGTVSTSTTEYLAVSDTSVRLRLTHSGAFGSVERVNESTLRVEDDLVVTAATHVSAAQASSMAAGNG